MGLDFVLVGSRRRIKVVERQVFGVMAVALGGLGFGCDAGTTGTLPYWALPRWTVKLYFLEYWPYFTEWGSVRQMRGESFEGAK